MYLTARLAHLEEKPNFSIGDTIKRGQVVGRMGNTGQSTAPHLHIDLNFGWHYQLYKMSNIPIDLILAKELMYFIDSELFGVQPHITTYYLDPTYKINGIWKSHPGYDLVPENRHSTKANFNIKWNRSKDARVLLIGSDPGGYGNFLHLGYKI